MAQAVVALLGTCDTKLEEILFFRNEILNSSNCAVILLDVGRSPTTHEAIDIRQQNLVDKHGDGKSPADLARGDVVNLMAGCASKEVAQLYRSGRIHGVAGVGGSGGTSLVATVMRDAVPIGVPKLIVSTIASGDTGPVVGETDITMMYSVVDVAGLNRLLRDILSNAGAAIAAAANAYQSRCQSIETGSRGGNTPSRRRVGITMFGVTTPGVDTIRRHLESNYEIEVYVFHATGHGGKAMERLVREGRLDAVLDLTTTEICDLVTGGVMSAGPNRLEAAAKAGIPYVVSLGATDMTNFGPKPTVPAQYSGRKLYEHNPVVTLMRSSSDECRQIAEYMSEKLLTHAKRPDLVQVWLPRGGVSMISTPGGPFADAKADSVLFETLKQGLKGSGIHVVEDTRDVNDDGFAKDIAEALVKLMGLKR
jgi:uncharacterized protein (UPF0261 family)